MSTEHTQGLLHGAACYDAQLGVGHKLGVCALASGIGHPTRRGLDGCCKTYFLYSGSATVKAYYSPKPVYGMEKGGGGGVMARYVLHMVPMAQVTLLAVLEQSLAQHRDQRGPCSRAGEKIGTSCCKVFSQAHARKLSVVRSEKVPFLRGRG